MKANIARDGELLGEFAAEEVLAGAREGQFLPTDFYWREGMENWVPLREVLGPEPWQPARPPLPLRTQLIVAGGIAAAILCALGLAIYWSNSGGGEAAPVATVAPVAPVTALDSKQTREERDLAIDKLRSKLSALPARAAAPLFLFYYDLRVEVRPSLHAQLEASIRGSENTIDPTTEETTTRTNFTLRAEYRDGEWFFKDYSGTTRNFSSPSNEEVPFTSDGNPPPMLATLLSLRTAPR